MLVAVSMIAFCGALSFSKGADAAQVNYQGKLLKDGTPYAGAALLKFALLDEYGESRWSNDATSVSGSEPQDGVNVLVSSGLFSVMLGADPMSPVNANSLRSVTELKLRVWVDTGSGYEQLSDQAVGSSVFALGLKDSQMTETDGRIGFNTTDPDSAMHLYVDEGTAVLHIEGESQPAVLSLNGEGSGQVLFRRHDELFWGIAGGHATDGDLRFNDASGSPVVSLEQGGRVGINKSAPAVPLEVRRPDGTLHGRLIQFSDYPYGIGLFDAGPGADATTALFSNDGYGNAAVSLGSHDGANFIPHLTARRDGNIGIGKTNPSAKLEIRDDGETALRISEVQANSAAQIKFDTTATNWEIGGDSNPEGFYIMEEGGDQGALFMRPGGYVGVGKTDPTSRLDVDGTVTADALRFPDGSVQHTATLVGPRGPQGVQGEPGPVVDPTALCANGQMPNMQTCEDICAGSVISGYTSTDAGASCDAVILPNAPSCERGISFQIPSGTIWVSCCVCGP
jgi:hypothetical protein